MTLLSLLMYFSLDPVFNINMITLAFLWLAFVEFTLSFHHLCCFLLSVLLLHSVFLDLILFL